MLYVQSMAKGGPAKDDLEAKRVESKSNQSAPLAAATDTTPTTSKPVMVVEKKIRRGFKSY